MEFPSTSCEVPRISPMSVAERDLIVELVQEEKVLHIRKMDRRLIAEKQKAWARVTEKYNTYGLGPKRTVAQVKTAWERLKIKAKHDQATRRRECLKTGGGPPPADVPDDSLKVLDVISEETAIPDCLFDSDAMPCKCCLYRGDVLPWKVS
ncbi:uncharacterized protein [Macrobrachium rosenbergii]|uniref:uncharacterized protein n=1 Tax=Macrobrachium rosenbergii TaxID=79674 RepID=UPI0034D5A32A